MSKLGMCTEKLLKSKKQDDVKCLSCTIILSANKCFSSMSVTFNKKFVKRTKTFLECDEYYSSKEL